MNRWKTRDLDMAMLNSFIVGAWGEGVIFGTYRYYAAFAMIISVWLALWCRRDAARQMRPYVY